MTKPLPIHLTRTPGGYDVSSPEIRGQAVGAPSRVETLAYARTVFRMWAGQRGIEVVDLTGEGL